MFMCEVISVPGDFLPFSAALSMAPCQRSFGPFHLCSLLLLLHIQSTTDALVFLCRSKFVAGVSSCIPLLWFSLGFLFVQGSLVCCSIRTWHFSALPACNTSAGQAWEHFSCSTDQEAQQSNFFQPKKYACHWYVSYFWKQPRLLHISSFACDQYQSLFFRSQETGTAWFIFQLLLSVALPFPYCKGCFDF